jgi:6-phosphogluconolactonase
MDADILIAPDPDALAREAAGRLAELAYEAVESRGRFSLALSGGSTPGALYRLLAQEPYRARIPWAGIFLFWADERCVPPDDPGSNYRLADEALIAHVPLPAENIYRVHGELEPQAAARDYARQLRDYFCGPKPRFDLVLLGLGDDGHTASLFPGSPALEQVERLTAAVEATYQDRPARRVTLTLPAINTARQVWFLVSGQAKAGIVQAVLEGSGALLPAQQVAPMAGRVLWLLDAAAAGQLRSRPGDPA